MNRYFDIAFAEQSQTLQRRRGSFDGYQSMAAHGEGNSVLGPDEIAFLQQRDSIYLASIGAHGWPYVQHRGGPAGFVKVLDPTRLAWGDRIGNRQFVSAGNIEHDNRISIIAVDYPNRQRLKLYGRATFDTEPDGELLAELNITERLEGLIVVNVEAFDWNCPKFITPRFTAEHIRSITDPLQSQIVSLKAELADAKKMLTAIK